MTARVELEPCYLLHSKIYTDSKILASFLTLNHGVVQTVLRVTKKKKLSFPPLAFTPMIVSWLESPNLKTITSYEQSHPCHALVGREMYCAMYLNEILVRMLGEQYEADGVFQFYQHALVALKNTASNLRQQEEILRSFELDLLNVLGFGIDFLSDVHGVPLRNDIQSLYQFYADSGFLFCLNNVDGISARCDSFSGSDIIAIGKREWTLTSLTASKKILRIALAPHLGGKPIRSRELFI